MKFAKVSIVVGVLLLQILTARAQEDSVNQSVDNSDGNAEEHMLNDQPESSPQETATRIVKPDAETTFPPLVRGGETHEKDDKKSDAVTPTAPASIETTTKGGSNSLHQNVALVLCVVGFLFFV